MNPFTLKIAKDQFTKNVKFDLVRYYLTNRVINWKEKQQQNYFIFSQSKEQKFFHHPPPPSKGQIVAEEEEIATRYDFVHRLKS